MEGGLSQLIPVPGAWHAGIDYVRMTGKREGIYGDLAALYRKAAYSLVGSTCEGEVSFKPWAWLGYYGETCNGVSYGSGPQGAIFQVSGWRASDVREMGLPYDGIPRCDIQATLWFPQDEPGLGARVADRSAKASGTMRGGRWKVRYIDGKGDGDTTYIGSRSSDSFLRIYDKQRESGDHEGYAYAWRFEAETADEKAREAWAAEGALPPGRDYWYAYVARALRARGVWLPGVSSVRLAAAPPRPKDEDIVGKRLAWLRNGVAPAVDKLLASGVPLSTVLEQLGLSGAVSGGVGRSCGLVANLEEVER